MHVRKRPLPSSDRSYLWGWPTLWRRSICCQTTCWGLHRCAWSRAGMQVLLSPHSTNLYTHLSSDFFFHLFPCRYMQSFQDILEFKDKNADDEKVTYEWVVLRSSSFVAASYFPTFNCFCLLLASQRPWLKSEIVTTTSSPPWHRGSWSTKRRTAQIRWSARTFSTSWIGSTWAGYPSGCCLTSTVSTFSFCCRF